MSAVTDERAVARESDRSRLYDVMSWIKGRMLNAMELWDSGKLPIVLLVVLHVFWWSIGMVVVSVCAGVDYLVKLPSRSREVS